jgi:hypothetical protein
MSKRFRKNSNGKDEVSAAVLIDDFFSYENLVHKRQT